MIRFPLSLEICENNALSESSSSSSNATSYRYPEANRCSQLTLEAENCFREIRSQESFAKMKAALLAISFIATPIAAVRAVVLRRISISCAIVGTIFFLLLCLEGLKRVYHGVKNARQQDISIYRTAEILINDISLRLKQVSTIFPEGAIQEGKLTQAIEINKAFRDQLDQWIDSLRLLHGWNRLRDIWQPYKLQFFEGIEEVNQHFVVDRSFEHLTDTLDKIIKTVESCRDNVENILTPKPNRLPEFLEKVACHLSFNELLVSINEWEVMRQHIQAALTSINNRPTETQ